MSKRVPTTTSIVITITNICIKIGDTVSASIEKGLIDNIVIYFLPRSVVFSTLIIIDQPLYPGQLVTAS